MKKILLVEDIIILAAAGMKILKKHHFNVLHSDSGEKAVEMIKNDSSISLILMDIDLGQGMAGTEAAQEILKIRDLPIVFLTSHTEKEYVEKVRNITKYGYIIKESGEFVLIESIRMAYELFDAHTDLKESEEKFRLIAENTSDGLIN